MSWTVLALGVCALVHAYRVRLANRQRNFAKGFTLSFHGLPVTNDTMDAVAQAVNTMGFEFAYTPDQKLITVRYRGVQETFSTELTRPTDYQLAGTLLVTLRMFAAMHEARFPNLRAYPFLWRGQHEHN